MVYRKIAYLIMGAACLLGGISCSRSEKTVEDSPSRDWTSELRRVNKLVLSQMSISKMATIDDLAVEDAKGMRQKLDAILGSLKIGSRKGAYSYTTYLRAYMDLSELRPEDITVDEDRKLIEIKLPPVRMEFAGRDMEIREEHYRVTGLRSAIDARERARLKEEMNTMLKREVEERPAFRELMEASARAKAQSWFAAFGKENGYTVTVK